MENGSDLSEFAFNGRGKRIGNLRLSGEQLLTKSGNIWCDELDVCEEERADGTVRGANMELGVHTGNGSQFYVRDHLWSNWSLSTSTGSITARYDYDPFGPAPRTILSGSYHRCRSWSGQRLYEVHSALCRGGKILRRQYWTVAERGPIGPRRRRESVRYAVNNPIRFIHLRACGPGIDELPAPLGNEKSDINSGLTCKEEDCSLKYLS